MLRQGGGSYPRVIRKDRTTYPGSFSIRLPLSFPPFTLLFHPLSLTLVRHGASRESRDLPFVEVSL